MKYDQKHIFKEVEYLSESIYRAKGTSYYRQVVLYLYLILFGKYQIKSPQGRHIGSKPIRTTHQKKQNWKSPLGT
jgi:hypothetical protein